MANSDEKVSKFVQAITQYAEEQRQKIHQEVEDFKIARLKQAEQEVLDDAFQLMQKERLALQSRTIQELSRRDLEARKTLLGKRLHMMNDVFECAEEKLRAYIATPAYVDGLKRSLAEMSSLLPEGTVYRLCRRDEPLLAILTPLCPAHCTLQTCDDIQLGGLCGVHEASGRMLDDTLDTKLTLQREWFTKTSGLTVE